ncbi:mucin-5AC-like isoform X2 [Pygocentrus nattereri]|uniref:mucin-5AC-like isoform X2 n=1 Tax=Pygocentrus nattereri TaxID=42514 RepID=UPI000814A6CF|nr:mucin-5AC-like isoform X2 [Pygocentrus nattereri]
MAVPFCWLIKTKARQSYYCTPYRQQTMKLLLLMSLLIYSSIQTAQTETLHVSQTEGRIIVLHCGRLTNGKVTWSRDTNGQRVDILTTHNGETSKHIADPDRRYGSQANLALIIVTVSQTDAGRYDCSGATVELNVTEETLHQTEKEGNTVALKCGRLTKGPVTWSRDTNGQRVDILTTHNGETTKHIADPDGRYDSRKDLVLIIYGVSQSDAGRYDCSGATVELSVTSGTPTSALQTPSNESINITSEGTDKSAPTSTTSSNNKNEEKATSTLQTPSNESINITNEEADKSAPTFTTTSNNKNEEKGTNNITASITATEAATTTPTSKTNITGTNATETATTTSTSTTNITGTNATETAMTTPKSTTNSTGTKATETATTTTTSTTNKTNRTGTTAPKTATNTTHHSSGGTTQGAVCVQTPRTRLIS